LIIPGEALSLGFLIWQMGTTVTYRFVVNVNSDVTEKTWSMSTIKINVERVIKNSHTE
jgi:hypothetical protein